MPAFAGKPNDVQMREIIVFLRSLSANSAGAQFQDASRMDKSEVSDEQRERLRPCCPRCPAPDVPLRICHALRLLSVASDTSTPVRSNLNPERFAFGLGSVWRQDRSTRMETVTQPLREEHRDLLPHIQQLRVAADLVGKAPIEETRRAVDEAYDFLVGHLIPHAQAEEAALYPVVGRAMGAPEATATMRRDHVEVGRLTAELGALGAHLTAGVADEAVLRELRRVLYGLHALVKVHFAKEEEVYLPLLDARLTANEATALFRDMEEAAGEAKRHAAAV
jgi:iron-sulfur cluster repair protein YtfE (RIC family)